MHLYWPDTTEVVCYEAGCTAADDNRVIEPPGRRITVGEFLDSVDEHARQWHGPEASRP